MTLTVEDGTGMDDADAFVSVADAASYLVGRGHATWQNGYGETWEGAIRRATAYLSAAISWKGYRTRGRAQALAWPRSGVEDAEGNAVPSDEVPAEVVRACCELAGHEFDNPGALSPVVDLSARVKREKIGPMEQEYFAAPPLADFSRPELPLVDDIIAGLVTSTGRGSMFARAARV